MIFLLSIHLSSPSLHSVISPEKSFETKTLPCVWRSRNLFKTCRVSGNIEVPKSQLKLHIQTAEGTTQFNVIQDGEIGKWTDSQLNTWTINWNCNNVNASLQTQILVHSECGILMTKTWIGYTNNSIDIIENDPLGFEIYLFDTWANDYTGDVYMPSFTILISLIGLLGASFLLRRKRID